MKVVVIVLLATLLLADAWPFFGHERRDTEHQLAENKEKTETRQQRDAGSAQEGVELKASPKAQHPRNSRRADDDKKAKLG